MKIPALGVQRSMWRMLSAMFVCAALFGQDPAEDGPMPYDADSKALLLAGKYLEGGPESRAAVLEALQHMGWGVRNHQGTLVSEPPAGTATGLAMRDYELEELLWKPSDQVGIRLISFAQAIAVPFEDADPEELAQDLIESIRRGAESENPQQRFWARFIVALGRASPENYDLLAPSPMPLIPPNERKLKELQRQGMQNPMQLMQAMQPTPVWPADDPVLAASPRPERDEDDPRTTTLERDEERMNQLSQQISDLSSEYEHPDEARRNAAQEKMQKISAEMATVMGRINASTFQQSAHAMEKVRRAQAGDFDDEDDEEEENDGPRFTAEWRDQPLSLLQVSLITRVLAADLHQLAAKSRTNTGNARLDSFRLPPLPLAAIRVAQAAPSAPSFGDQFTGAIGDIWATTTGAYTGAVLEHHLPENKFSKGSAIANTIIAWHKTIVSIVQSKIVIEVENAPLVRTKTRSPGEQRTARANISIDYPKHDVLKAIRAAVNVSTIDLQLPDGGPVSGAKVVWRLSEGSYNTKYQTAKGGWEYKPELAVVQFAEAGSNAAYISTTNSAGDATITIEGVPQRKQLPSTVRPYPRRAVISVEVTIKVGNMTQDLNDAISLAMGGPVAGGLSFIADMMLRTSLFFRAGKVFEVRDWKEPAWEGEFEILIKGSGSKHEKGEKGGPDADYTWRMDRLMEGRLHTPDWEEDEEIEKENDTDKDGRHQLEVDGDSRYFRLSDSSTAKTRTSNNRYEASGPLQKQSPSHKTLKFYSRSEPSGSAELMFLDGRMKLDIRPFFGAECLVSRSESGGGRSSNKSGPEYLSLLDGISPTTFTVIEDNVRDQEYIEGSKTFDYYHGSLPFVPSFPVEVTVKYRLWKNGPPPKNK